MNQAEEDALVEQHIAKWRDIEAGYETMRETVRAAMKAGIALGRESAARVCDPDPEDDLDGCAKIICKALAASIRRGD